MLLILEPALRRAGQVRLASGLPLRSEFAELQFTHSFSPGEKGFLLQLCSWVGRLLGEQEGARERYSDPMDH